MNIDLLNHLAKCDNCKTLPCIADIQVACAICGIELETVRYRGYIVCNPMYEATKEVAYFRSNRYHPGHVPVCMDCSVIIDRGGVSIQDDMRSAIQDAIEKFRRVYGH